MPKAQQVSKKTNDTKPYKKPREIFSTQKIESYLSKKG